MNNNNKIIYNTFIVYGQLIISMIIGLLSVRIVLKALGEESYGIYMLVMGVIAMLNVITTSLSNTSMRFISHSLGKCDLALSQKTFNTSIVIHILFAILLIVILEIGGYFMFEYILNIPDNKIYEAKVVYQLMVITAFISLISVPYDSIINAHENLLILSIVTILGQVLQVLLALYILYFCNKNQLIIYGIGLTINQLIQRFIKQLYSSKYYVECKFNIKKGVDFSILKSMINYVGWDFLSTAISILVTNLKNIYVNMFFGVKLNAGQGIATNVNGYVNNISRGITCAITPQMNKSEGAGNRKRLIDLTFTGVKYTSFMFALFAIPLVFENNYILTLWLGTVPSYAIIFCQLILVNQLVDKTTWQICNALRSVGNIKMMTIFECASSLLYVFIMYYILKIGKSPEWIYIMELLFIIINGSIRLILAKRLLGINTSKYVKATILPVFIPMVIPIFLILAIQSYMLESITRTVLVFIIFISTYALLFLLIGMKKNERNFIGKYTSSLLSR